jgi:hypothetical protein
MKMELDQLTLEIRRATEDQRFMISEIQAL